MVEDVGREGRLEKVFFVSGAVINVVGFVFFLTGLLLRSKTLQVAGVSLYAVNIIKVAGAILYYMLRKPEEVMSDKEWLMHTIKKIGLGILMIAILFAVVIFM